MLNSNYKVLKKINFGVFSKDITVTVLKQTVPALLVLNFSDIFTALTQLVKKWLKFSKYLLNIL